MVALFKFVTLFVKEAGINSGALPDLLCVKGPGHTRHRAPSHQDPREGPGRYKAGLLASAWQAQKVPLSP